jgi:CMP-N-acetylneuraminic acid synthetase
MIVTIIPAKSQSTRLENKNMLMVGGCPMIDWSIKCALSSKVTHQVFVSSNSKEILSHAKSMNVESIIRPEDLLGETPIIEVYRHAVKYIEENLISDRITTVIGLQPDHPDRTISPERALKHFVDHDLDRLFTCQADGTKNGSYYIISRFYIDTGQSRKDDTIVDDCTNIHFAKDVAKAEANILNGNHYHV